MSQRRLTLPNIITLARIGVCPLLFMLIMAPGTGARYAAFVLFVLAGLSDVWDGYLARKYDLVTDIGKLLDPLADKLLLVVTFVPFVLLSHRPGTADDVPLWGPLPVWVVVVIFARELFITVFRAWAARRGVIIAAGRSGKHKALVQSLFIGGFLLWLPLSQMASDQGWTSGLWTAWSLFHRLWVGVTLLIAVVLTVYSLLDYLWRYRSLLRPR